MRKKIIFGATKAVNTILQYMDIDEVEYIVDNDINKKYWGTKNVYLPEKLNEENKDTILIIVVSTFYNEIKQQLLEMGFRENIEFINGRKKYRLDIRHHSAYLEGLENEELTLNYSVDQVGLTIVSKTNDKIVYRGIYHGMEEHVSYVLQMIQSSPKLKSMIIDTAISELNFDSSRFGMMLEHRRLDGLVEATEWSPEMFFDAMKFMIELARELSKYKLGLKDMHMYNMARWKGQWVFYDFGSIIRGESRNEVLETFLPFAIYPMVLMKKGNFYKANQNLEIIKSGNSGLFLEQRDITAYLLKDEQIKYERMMEAIHRAVGMNEVLDQFVEFIEDTTSIEQETPWGNYQQELFEKNESAEKGQKIIDFIREVHPNKVLDLAGNAGGYCYQASKAISEDIEYKFMDYDFAAIDAGYQILKENNVAVVAPCFKDFKKIDKATAKNNKADLVLVLALIHHLVFSQGMTFRKIIDIIESCSKQYFVIEFSDDTYLYVKQWMTSDFSWYTLDNLIKEIGKNSEVIKIDNYNRTEEGRILVFCKKGI